MRVGAPEGVAAYVLAEAATEICRAHPQLELQVVALPRTFSLSKREADIAIAVSAPPSGRLKFRKISDYTLHLYATADYLARHDADQDDRGPEKGARHRLRAGIHL